MNEKKKAFTIIEVVLVLAIAGLIFVMVFIALPALQRARRDTQRRNDVAEILAAAAQYRTHNGGRLPGTATSGARKGWPCFMSGASCPELQQWNAFIKKYAPGLTDPSTGKEYHVFATAIYGSSCREQAGKIERQPYGNIAVCHKTYCEDDQYKQAATYETFTLIYKSEGSGLVCATSH